MAGATHHPAVVIDDRGLDRSGPQIDPQGGHRVTGTPESIGHVTGRVVVVGSLNVDLVVGLDRMPESGETVFGHRLERHAGGKGLNQAVAAARLGASVDMVGAVGDDSSGEWLRRVVTDEGIGDASIASLAGASGTALIEVDAAGANRIVVIPGTNGQVSAAQVDAAIRSLADVAVVLAQGEVPADAVAAAMRAGRSIGAVTILNPAPVFAYPTEVFADVDYVVPNEHEAAKLTAMSTATTEDASQAARELVRMGARCAVITRGGKGVVWATETALGTRGAFLVAAIDTVAAGDAFCGGLAAALAGGGDLDQALRWASAAGALATTVAGAVPSLPTRSDVESLLDSTD